MTPSRQNLEMRVYVAGGDNGYLNTGYFYDHFFNVTLLFDICKI